MASRYCSGRGRDCQRNYDRLQCPHVFALHPEQLNLLSTLLALAAVCFAIGVVAVLAGVGGGVLFVPIVGALFSIHVDFVRGAGLIVALVGAVAAAPHLISRGFSEPRVSVPLALAGSIGSVLGAQIGLSVPTRIVLLALGIFMVLIAVQTFVSALRDQGRREAPVGRISETTPSDRLAKTLGLSGTFYDPQSGVEQPWRIRRLIPSLIAFVAIGTIGGMLGVGAGWANVPVLAGFMTLPLRMAAATSGLIIVANASAAAWVYLSRGAVQPLVVLPALVGMIFGTRIGARLLGIVPGWAIRLVVILVLSITGARTIAGALV